MNYKGEVVLVSKHGYCFIADSVTGRQYFLHCSDIVNRVLLKTGDIVQFDIDEHPHGRKQAQAVNAVKIAAADIAKDETHDPKTAAV